MDGGPDNRHLDCGGFKKERLTGPLLKVQSFPQTELTPTELIYAN